MVPLNKFARSLNVTKAEIHEVVKGLELKLSGALIVLSSELDGLKEPLKDIISEIGQERDLISKELERT